MTNADVNVSRQCECNLRTKLVGDGCEVCNPELAAEIAKAQAEYDREERLVRDIGIWFMEREGDDGDPDELLYSGGPIPEPWGSRWQKFEQEARELVGLMTANGAGNSASAAGAKSGEPKANVS